MTIQHVMVVGAGTMGSGIAQVMATGGLEVTCVDPMPGVTERAKAGIAKSTAKLLEKGNLNVEQKARADAIQFSPDLASANTADLIVEAATENPELKFRLFRDLDAAARPGIILASNTSSISITKLAAATRRPEHVIGMHFMNPVPVMKLVEVVRGLGTSKETIDQITALCRKLGKEPVEANDSPGFISNRILCPMINEAVFALEEQVGTPEAIDTVMRLGMNHPMGPLALADLIGLDVVLFIMEILQRDLGEDKYRPAPLLRRMVDAGYLGRKAGRGFYKY